MSNVSGVAGACVNSRKSTNGSCSCGGSSNKNTRPTKCWNIRPDRTLMRFQPAEMIHEKYFACGRKYVRGLTAVRHITGAAFRTPVPRLQSCRWNYLQPSGPQIGTDVAAVRRARKRSPTVTFTSTWRDDSSSKQLQIEPYGIHATAVIDAGSFMLLNHRITGTDLFRNSVL